MSTELANIEGWSFFILRRPRRTRGNVFDCVVLGACERERVGSLTVSLCVAMHLPTVAIHFTFSVSVAHRALSLAMPSTPEAELQRLRSETERLQQSNARLRQRLRKRRLGS